MVTDKSGATGQDSVNLSVMGEEAYIHKSNLVVNYDYISKSTGMRLCMVKELIFIEKPVR